MAATLVRISQLARFWELNPTTLIGWIRQGKLAAIRSPGNHFRVRVADVRAFCEREGMPVPPFAAPPARRVVAAALSEAAKRAVARALKGPGVTLETPDDPYEALVTAAAGPTRATMLVVLPAAAERFDAAAAIRALAHASTAHAGAAADGEPGRGALFVIALGAATRAQASALQRAGATRVLLRSQVDDLPTVARDLLSLDE